MPISWQIPNATKIVHAARAKGVPIDAVAPGSRVHQAILEIAKGLKPALGRRRDQAPPRPLRGLLLIECPTDRRAVDASDRSHGVE